MLPLSILAAMEQGLPCEHISLYSPPCPSVFSFADSDKWQWAFHETEDTHGTLGLADNSQKASGIIFMGIIVSPWWALCSQCLVLIDMRRCGLITSMASFISSTVYKWHMRWRVELLGHRTFTLSLTGEWQMPSEVLVSIYTPADYV